MQSTLYRRVDVVVKRAGERVRLLGSPFAPIGPGQREPDRAGRLAGFTGTLLVFFLSVAAEGDLRSSIAKVL